MILGLILTFWVVARLLHVTKINNKIITKTYRPTVKNAAIITYVLDYFEMHRRSIIPRKALNDRFFVRSISETMHSFEHIISQRLLYSFLSAILSVFSF